MAERAPILEPFEVGAGLAEELQLHLLKLAHAEDKVAGGDLIAEGFADLADAGGDLLAGGAHHILEVDEYALRRLGAQIQFAYAVFVYALEGFEHQVKLADAGKILFAADGAFDIVLGDILLQLRVAPAVAGFLAVGKVLNQLIGAEARLAGLAVHQRIVEAAHMAGGHPHLAVHQDARVQTHIVLAFLDELLPPGALDVVFEFHAQRAVVPGVGQAAVNFGAGINKAARLAQRDQLVHGQVAHCVIPPVFTCPCIISRFGNLSRKWENARAFSLLENARAFSFAAAG